MKNIQVQNVIWKEGRHYVAQCLSVDVSSFGKTKAEALENLSEALELYFEDARPARLPTITRPEVINLSIGYA